MDYEVLHKPSFALALINLHEGEEIQAETGAMVSMSDTIKMDTSLRGGIFGGLKRKVLGGESFFLNSFRAEAGPGEVTLAPPVIGDIEALQLAAHQTVMVQSGSFLAASKDVRIDSQWGGAKTFFSREGLWMLRCSGEGLLFISSYGAIHPITLNEGERYTVDTGHMVAFDETVEYSVGKAGSWKSTVLGGEGLVCKLRGPGRFFMQTRSEDAYLEWLMKKMPSPRK